MSSRSAGTAAQTRRIFALLFALGVSGCGGMTLGEPGEPSSRRAAYERALHGPARDSASAAWLHAGARALTSALPVETPFEERVFFDDGAHSAIGYQLNLLRGQRVEVEVDPPRLRRGGVFMELYAVRGGQPRFVASAKRGEHALTVRAGEPGSYIVRIQPERTHAGLYRVSLRGAGTIVRSPEPDRTIAGLVFPVAGHDAASIGSRFGDARDGGSRSHRGVDIFATRGTLALAAADGVVLDATSTPIGGKVVWLAARGLGFDLYYAHLDEHLVTRGQQVRAGEPIGRVGNTGNARGTRPHLHFGVYRPGGRIALDPGLMLRDAPGGPVRLAGRAIDVEVDVGALGEWRRASAAELRVRAAPDLAARVLAELPRNAAVRLIGASNDWYRVALPDGMVGFARASELERLD